MTRPTGRLRRSERLLRSRDFQRVARSGTRAASRNFVMLVAQGRAATRSEKPTRRLGITASRKVGHAVVRNHVKRRVREWFRHVDDELPRELDVVVIARRGAGALDTPQINEELERLACKLRGRWASGERSVGS